MAKSSLRKAFAIFGFRCAKKTVIDLATEREGYRKTYRDRDMHVNDDRKSYEKNSGG